MVVVTRGKSCDTCCKKIWTSCFCLLWVIVIVGVLMCHIAIGRLYPEIADTPKNLREGFDSLFGFDRMAADSEIIKANAKLGMEKCSVVVLPVMNCNTLVVNTGTATSTTELAAIKTAMDSSLTTIRKVTGDKYFGLTEMKAASTELDKVQVELDKLDDVAAGGSCAVTNQAYCNLYNSADRLVTDTAEVRKAVDTITDSKEVKDFEDSSDRLVYLHALPYPLVFAMLFFSCFWWKDAACCCCGGSGCGCFGLYFFIGLWFEYFVFSTVIVAAGFLIMDVAKNEKIGDIFAQEVTLDDLLNHIELTFPEFYNLVFKDLLAALKSFLGSFIVFEIFCVVIGFYACCVCCCMPYSKKAVGTEGTSERI